MNRVRMLGRRRLVAILTLGLLLSECKIHRDCEIADMICSPLSWLTLIKTQRPRFLFVANTQVSSLSAFTINDYTGRLSQITDSPFTNGAASGTFFNQPVVDQSGGLMFVSNYQSDQVFGYSINAASGTIAATPGSPFAWVDPMPVAVDSRSRYLFVSENNAPALVRAMRIASDGSVSLYQSVSGGSQPGFPIVDVFDRFLFVGDFFGTNAAYGYKIDQGTGALTPGATATYNTTSSIPTVDPSGKFVYIQNTAGGLNGALLCPLSIDQTTGGLTTIDQDTVSVGVQCTGLPGTTTNPPGTVLTPDGRFLYASISGDQTKVAAYSIDSSTGILTTVPGMPFATTAVPAADTVRQPAMHPSGKFLYVSNDTSGTIDCFAINSVTGALSAIAASPVTGGAGPGPVKIDAGGFFAFVPNYGGGAGNTVSVFSINQTTGALAQISGSPYTVGTGPFGMAVVSYAAF